MVERHGRHALVNRVGHAFIKHRMREEGAVFAGEVSGHYYFRDFYQARHGHRAGAADARARLAQGAALVRAARALARALLHLRRDQHARWTTSP